MLFTRLSYEVIEMGFFPPWKLAFGNSVEMWPWFFFYELSWSCGAAGLVLEETTRRPGNLQPEMSINCEHSSIRSWHVIKACHTRLVCWLLYYIVSLGNGNKVKRWGRGGAWGGDITVRQHSSRSFTYDDPIHHRHWGVLCPPPQRTWRGGGLGAIQV